MKIINWKDCMEKHKLKNFTLNRKELHRVYNYPIDLRDTKTNCDNGFINKDNGSMGGTHWNIFIVKDNKSFYCDSFGGASDKLLLNQTTKPITHHNYKVQDIKSNFCGSNCLYLFFFIERMKYCDTFLKM